MPDEADSADFIDLLTSQPVDTAEELFRRCEALAKLASSTVEFDDAMGAVFRSLTVPVSVDSGFALRVAAADAAWKIGQCRDLSLPIVAWALRDQYWGYSRTAVKILLEMGHAATHATPELVNFTKRRLKNGPLFFEQYQSNDNEDSLLTLAAKALVGVGFHREYLDDVRSTLKALEECDDPVAAKVARIWPARLGASQVLDCSVE